MIVDAHHHFWNPERIAQPWRTEEHAVITRAFEPADLHPRLVANRIDRTGVGVHPTPIAATDPDISCPSTAGRVTRASIAPCTI